MLDIVSATNGKCLVITQSGIKGYIDSSDFEIINSGENSKFESLDKVSKVKNVTTVLNFRELPSTNSNILDTLPNNTILHIKGKQGDWYKVSINNKEGFVYGLFTDVNQVKDQKIGNVTVDQAKKNIVNIQVQQNKKDAYKETLKGMMNEAKAQNQAKQATVKSAVVSPKTTTKVNNSKSTVKVNKSDVEMYTSAKRGTVSINSGWLNMRSGASINDKEIGKLDRGEKITVLGHDGNWYLVRTANGQEGFVFGQYINVNNDSTKHQAPSHNTAKPSQGHHDVVKPVKPAVINNAPVLKANNLTLTQGEKFTDAMLKATANDKEDGNLTDSIKVIENTVNANKPGNYVVKVKVTDKQGASMTKTFTVTVTKKVVKPVVMNNVPVLEGHNVTIVEGQDFNNSMLGLSATDKEDGNLTDSIKVTGEVNTTKVGTYKVTATVTDKQGAKATKTFEVIVKAKPVVGWSVDSKEFHNAVANEFYKLDNQLRDKWGKGHLEVATVAVDAANWKAQDMLKTGKLDHKDAEGKATWEHKEFEDVNGENIADTWIMKENGLTQKDAEKLAKQLIDMWASSAAHLNTLIDDTATGQGFGFAVGKDGIVYAAYEVSGVNQDNVDWN